MFTTLGNNIPRNGLVGEWLLDGNANDTGGTNNGTATNVTWVKTTKGYQSQAGSFNASATTNVNIPFTALGNGEYSFSFIFKTPSNINNGDFNYILDFSSGNVTQNRLSIRIMPTIYGGLLRVYIRGNGSETYRDSLLALNDDNYHIGYVYIKKATSTINIYIDGALNQSAQYGGVMGTVSTNNSFRLGSYHDGATVGGFNGNIQNIRIYNRVLSQDEIQLLYLEGLKKLGPANIASYPKLFEGITAYYDFRGDATNLVDGVAGTVTGATLTTDRFGNSNSAYSFNGTTDRIIGGGVNFNGGIMSMGAYVKFNGTGDYCIISETSATNFIKYGIYYFGSTNTIYFNRTKNNIGGNNATYVTNLGTSDWHHLFMTYDGTNIRGYLDGNLVNTASASGNGTASGINGIGIGVMYKEGTPTYENYTNGIISQVFYLNKVLSSDEVKALYDLTSKDYIYPSKVYDLPNLRDGLVLDLDSNGKDLSGNGNHGTLVNSPALVRQGRAKGLSYNGSNQYTYINLSTGLGGNFTINTWVKFNTTGTNQAIIEAYVPGYNNYWFSIVKPNTNLISVNLYDGTNNPNKNSGTTIVTSGVWYMITMVRNTTSDTIEGFINGISFGSTNDTTTSIPTYSKINIGYRQNPNIYLGGSEIQPKIWNKALTPIQIQQLYYAQKGNFIY